jgi:hypothetical protein
MLQQDGCTLEHRGIRSDPAERGERSMHRRLGQPYPRETLDRFGVDLKNVGGELDAVRRAPGPARRAPSALTSSSSSE